MLLNKLIITVSLLITSLIIFSTNRIYNVILLIIAYIIGSILLIKASLLFIGLVVLLIYAGSVLVFFLFIIILMGNSKYERSDFSLSITSLICLLAFFTLVIYIFISTSSDTIYGSTVTYIHECNFPHLDSYPYKGYSLVDDLIRFEQKFYATKMELMYKFMVTSIDQRTYKCTDNYNIFHNKLLLEDIKSYFDQCLDRMNITLYEINNVMHIKQSFYTIPISYIYQKNFVLIVNFGLMLFVATIGCITILNPLRNLEPKRQVSVEQVWKSLKVSYSNKKQNEK
jgi:NADH:ubiquinone oxidoreductase subunit 6 (subunit J)